MKEIFKKIEGNKILFSISNIYFEKEAILNATYKFTDKCFINFEILKELTEIYFQCKNEECDIENIALSFGNELIDQQVRLNVGREFRTIRDELVKKAFSTINNK